MKAQSVYPSQTGETEQKKSFFFFFALVFFCSVQFSSVLVLVLVKVCLVAFDE